MNPFQCSFCSFMIYPSHRQINRVSCEHCFEVYALTEDGKPVKQKSGIAFVKNSEIQPGTTGQWQNEPFRVTGRCLLHFPDSVFNYWTILFEKDNTLGWLLEGYGLFYIVRDLTNLSDKYKFNEIGGKAGDMVYSGESGFLVQKRLPCKKYELEGQAFLPHTDEDFIVIELANTAGEYLFCLSFAKDLFIYAVKPVVKSALLLDKLRTSTQHVHEMKCGRCHSAVKVYNYPFTRTVICPECGQSHHYEYGQYTKESRRPFDTHANAEAALAVGERVSLKGNNYTVYGYVVKEEENAYKSRWREYYLYTDAHEVAILSEFDGHWIFILEAAEGPVLTNYSVSSFTYANKSFDKFNDYGYAVIEAVGEFPYDLLGKTNVTCFEYIAPPLIWIFEKDKTDGISCFLGEHVSDSEIKSIVTSGRRIPWKKGLGAVAHSVTDSLNNSKMLVAFLISASLLMAVHGLIGASKEKRELLPMTTFYFNDSTDIINLPGYKFKLDKPMSNLSFNVTAPVSNSWFALSGSLINEANGKSYSFEQGVEFYSGYTEGESWSEGSQSENYHLTAIPAGNYLLEMQGLRENQYTGRLAEFSVGTEYDVEEASNLMWVIGLIMAWPLGFFLLSSYNNRRRWENSPFSKFDND